MAKDSEVNREEFLGSDINYLQRSIWNPPRSSRTAYQRCHELRYEQFGSAQGLLEAMRDYQRMAPTRLTDETLESVLWNKAPVELQREVREIPDGSVQELLQRLLRAEEVVAERKRRSQASEEYKIRVLLSQVVHLGARMSKEVRVEIV